jgi:hypothetical protein
MNEEFESMPFEEALLTMEAENNDYMCSEADMEAFHKKQLEREYKAMRLGGQKQKMSNMKTLNMLCKKFLADLTGP